MLKTISINLLFALLATSVGAEQYARYAEPYRPGFHYTPEVNWTNEPNGLVYENGVYHLFYQANPFNNQFGNQTWGHATSPDLVHWSQQPAAIPPGAGVMSFSGSAVVDPNNTAGFGAGAIVAAYTGFKPADSTQDQRLAYSTDHGATWTKYGGNPVIPRLLGVEGIETRDPKVFWHSPTSSWKMVLSHGGQQKLSLWTSTDLKAWTRTQNFTASEIAAPLGGWEVPDLFPLPVKDAAGAIVDEKWVLSMTPSSGSPAGGNGVNFWVGEYNGATFTSENATGTPLWADFGRDFDGQQSWNNTPDGRVIWTGIMQSYGESVPTTPWRGQMAIPRELSLVTTVNGPRLVQQPIPELQSLRGPVTTLANVAINPGSNPLASLGLQGDMLEIIATIDPGAASSVGLRVRQGLNGNQTTVGYNPFAGTMFVDRRSSGNISFSSGAGGIHSAPLSRDENGYIKLHTFVDRSSIEVFGGDGQAVISDLIFPDPLSKGVSLFATGGTAQLISLEAYPLSSIWQPGPTPIPGGPVVARWSMEPLPQSIGVPWAGPSTVDSRTRLGEGAALGTTNSRYEPDPAVDNLWMTSNRMPTSTATPPASMFAPGKTGGALSYNPGATTTLNDALYLPVDRYGEDLAFRDAFSVELFFKTDGNQANAGLMQLVLQGESSFRYGIIVNEGGAGNVRFAINDKVGQIPLVDSNTVSARNYADGQWHYLLATYNPAAGANGELKLTLANEDGTAHTATTSINGSFAGLPASSDGNLLIGRHQVSLSGAPRTFRGLIDEVQFTRGLIPTVLRLGALPDDALIPGDYNHNGVVDAADYTSWRDTRGQSTAVPGSGADGNGNGVIDQEDYEIWRSNFGSSSSAPVSQTTSTVVPEPGSLILTALLLAAHGMSACSTLGSAPRAK